MVSQVLVLRELLVLAQGSELKLALGLWGWLLWTGLGSLLGGWWLRPSLGRGAPRGAPKGGEEGEEGGPPGPPLQDYAGRMENGVSRQEMAPARLGGLLVLLGLLLPATVLLIRALPAVGLLPWGQSLPLATALWLFPAVLAPFGLVSGYFFPCACRVLATLTPEGATGGAPGGLRGGSTIWRPWARPWGSWFCSFSFWAASPAWGSAWRWDSCWP